jgi:hypothetical protein
MLTDQELVQIAAELQNKAMEREDYLVPYGYAVTLLRQYQENPDKDPID